MPAASASARSARWGTAARYGIPLAIFLLAVLVRGAYLLEIRHFPNFELPAVDAAYHDYWAWGMVSGAWDPGPNRPDPQIPSTPYFRPPLCPYFLALIYRAFGHSFMAARLVQLLIGAFSSVLLYLFAKRLFGAGTGLVAGILGALYWALVYFDMELREIVLLVPAHILLMWAMFKLRARPRVPWAAAAGLLIGFSILGKPNTLLFIPVAVVWFAVLMRRALSRRRIMLLSGVLVAAAALVVAPVTIRNVVRGSDFVLVSSNGGVNLYIAHNPRATGYSVEMEKEFPTFSTAFDYPAIVRYVEKLEGRSLKHSEVSAWFAHRALAHIRRNPGRTFAQLLRKAVLFWSGIEIVSEKDLNWARQESKVLRAIPLNFAAVLALGLLGLGLCIGPMLRKPASDKAGASVPPAACPAAGADIVLIVLFVGVYFGSFLPFFVTARYRVPLIPLILVFAAFGVCRIGTGLRAKRWRAAALQIGCLVALYLLINHQWFGISMSPFKALYDRAIDYDQHGQLEEAIRYYSQALAVDALRDEAHNNIGIDLLRLDRTDRALYHFSEALRINPDDAHAHHNIGVAFAKKERLDLAVQHYRKSLAYEPDLFKAHHNLGLALNAQNRAREAIAHFSEAIRLYAKDADVHKALADALLQQNEPEPALKHYSEVLDLQPNHKAVHRPIGMILSGLGKAQQAIPHLSEALRAKPDDANVHFELGLILADLGETDKAVTHYSEVLRINPEFGSAHNNLAIILWNAKRLDQAVRHFSEAFRIDPDNETARFNLEKARKELAQHDTDTSPER